MKPRPRGQRHSDNRPRQSERPAQLLPAPHLLLAGFTPEMLCFQLMSPSYNLRALRTPKHLCPWSLRTPFHLSPCWFPCLVPSCQAQAENYRIKCPSDCPGRVAQTEQTSRAWGQDAFAPYSPFRAEEQPSDF